MRNLDELCTALHAPPSEEFTPIDLDQIMAAGGRLRRRRRLLACGAAAATVAVIVLAVALPWRLRAAPPPSLAGAPASSASPSVARSGPASSEDPSSPQPWGEVVATGTDAACGEQVVWMQRVSLRQLPGVRFGLMAGCRSAAGGLRSLVATNETDGRDDAPGFHAVQAQTEIGDDRVVVAQFGYYAGAAAKITAVQAGRPIVAHQAAWSVDPNIVIFWFDRFTGEEPTGLAAFDAAGAALPAGNATVGHG